jgi:hypothetical protein
LVYDIVGNYHIHYCFKCFDSKNVVVASLDAEIYSVVQGDTKTTERHCQKKIVAFAFADDMSRYLVGLREANLGEAQKRAGTMLSRARFSRIL